MTDALQEREDESAWTKLRRRKVVQWALAYTAAAWTLMEVTDHFTETYAWPPLLRQVSTLALTLGVLVVIGAARWRYYGTLQTTGTQAEPAGTVQRATSLRDGRMSMVVLPLRNLSADPEQEYFGDGLTEELIAQLGRLQPKQLGVIAGPRPCATRAQTRPSPRSAASPEWARCWRSAHAAKDSGCASRSR